MGKPEAQRLDRIFPRSPNRIATEPGIEPRPPEVHSSALSDTSRNIHHLWTSNQDPLFFLKICYNSNRRYRLDAAITGWGSMALMGNLRPVRIINWWAARQCLCWPSTGTAACSSWGCGLPFPDNGCCGKQCGLQGHAGHHCSMVCVTQKIRLD